MTPWWVVPALITFGASTAILNGSRWALIFHMTGATILVWVLAWFLWSERGKEIR